MNHSGDAAEQIVRLSLEGTEVALKLTGTAAKELALLLVSALRSKRSALKPKGKARLTSMLKSGKPLEIFSVANSDLKKFAEGAKQYGIVYCVLRNKKNRPDGMCDIMVKAEDAPKISRVVERFQFATVDKAKIEREIVAERAEQEKPEQETAPGDEREAPDLGDTEKMLDDFLGTDEGKAEPDTPEVADHPDPSERTEVTDPDFFTEVTAEEGRLSGPPSGSKRSTEKGASDKRPSVREELREIKAAQKRAESEPVPERREGKDGRKPKRLESTKHKLPQGRRRQKPKRLKER